MLYRYIWHLISSRGVEQNTQVKEKPKGKEKIKNSVNLLWSVSHTHTLSAMMFRRCLLLHIGIAKAMVERILYTDDQQLILDEAHCCDHIFRAPDSSSSILSGSVKEKNFLTSLLLSDYNIGD